MARKTKAQRKKAQHTGKIPYDTIVEAWEAADRINIHNEDRNRGVVRPYKCPFCDKFHVGHDWLSNALARQER